MEIRPTPQAPSLGQERPFFLPSLSLTMETCYTVIYWYRCPLILSNKRIKIY